ncbi:MULTISPECIES: hypothetical protein [Burkholderia cepacia complex]|nr:MULTISPECIES: hypothetical protein [Burkholderia cepacia complex]
MALAQFAPMIAGWLGGSKAEDVATKVVGIAQSVTGQSAPDAALAALQADPNLSLQFQKAVLDQQAQLAATAADVAKAQLEHDAAVYQSAAADRQSARQMAIATHDTTQRNLAYLYTLGLFAVIATHFYIVIAKIPVDPVTFTILGNAEGVLTAMVLGSKEFFFGSTSAGTKQAQAITEFAVSPGAVTTSTNQKG